MSTTQGTSTPASAGTTLPVPAGQLFKLAAADAKTTNALLLVLVLCMSGLMPDQLASLCGA